MISDEDLLAFGFTKEQLSDGPPAGGTSPRPEGQDRSAIHIGQRRRSAGHYREVLNLSGWIIQALPRLPDRQLLSDRLAAKLTGQRRGALKLPVYFPQEVRALTKLTKRELVASVFAFQANNRAPLSLNQRLRNFVHRVFPDGQIWTGSSDSTEVERQLAVVKRLPASDWPRLGTRSAWPSTPSVDELMEMSRRGLTPRPMQKHTEQKVKYHLTRAQVRSEPDLCKAIVRQQVVGVRIGQHIPSKYLKYFRRRWNFLILTSPWCLPIGLARSLTALWITNPSSLWLLDKCSFKCYLKKTPYTAFCCARPGPW